MPSRFANPARSSCSFRETFDSLNTFSANGGILLGNATIQGGSLVCDGGATTKSYFPIEIDDFFNRGGTVRVKLTASGSASDSNVRRILTYARTGDLTYNLMLLMTRNTMIPTAQVQMGTSTRYWTASSSTAMQDNISSDVVMTWEPWSTGSLKVYLDGVLTATDNSAGGAVFSAEGATNKLYVGGWSSTPNFSGSIQEVEVYPGRVMTSTEILKMYSGSLLMQPQYEKALIALPLQTNFSGTLLTTPNKGLTVLTGSAVLAGNGSTASTFPTFQFPDGIKVDGGDYLDTTWDPTINYNTPFTMAFYARARYVQFISTSAMSNLDSAISGGRGVELGFFGGSALHNVRINIFASSSNAIQMSAVIPREFAGVVVCTYSGIGNASGVRIYIDGVPLVLTVSTNNLNNNSTLSNRPLLIGCSHNGVNKSRFMNNGSYVQWPAYWNYELTPMQVQIVTEYIRKLSRGT